MAKAPVDIRSLARAHTELALQTLAGIARNGENEGARVSAACALLDRGYGKAPQAHTGEDGEGAIEVVIRHILVGSRNASAPLAELNGSQHQLEHGRKSVGDNHA